MACEKIFANAKLFHDDDGIKLGGSSFALFAMQLVALAAHRH